MFIGIDIHRRYAQVAVMDENGDIVEEVRIENTNLDEMGLAHPYWDSVPQPQPWTDDYEDGLDAVDEDGTVPVPDGPGLGVDVDWDFVEANEVGRQRYD